MSLQLEQRVSDSVSTIARMAAQGDTDARAVSPDVYLSEALLALEYERIFKHQWACLGRVDELPNPGDYLTAEADRAQLRRKYLPEISKALPGRKVARFYQIENKIRAALLYEIGANIPLAKTAK